VPISDAGGLDLDALDTAVAAIPTTAMRGTDSAATSAKQDTMETTLGAIPTTAMRGTDSAATEAKQDTMQTAVSAIPTTAMRGTDSAATEAKQDTMQTAQDLIPTTMVGTDGALTAIQDSDLNADLDVYEAKIGVIDDEGGTTDRWVVMWFKNGAPVLSGITSPTVQCVKTADGTDLFAAAAMTEITAGMYRKTQATTRIVSGVGYCAVAVATIGGSARTHREVIGRDSTA